MIRIFLFSLIFAISCGVHGTETKLSVTKKIIDNLSIPWGMEQITPNQLLVTLRRGDMVLVDIKHGTKKAIKGVPNVLNQGQGGLFDVKKSPHYAKDGWLYFTYAKPVKGQGATTLARAKLDGERLIHWQDLLITQSRTKHYRHYGSRIAFDKRGHVYFSVGDRGVRDNAQNLMTHAGSILRLNLNGSIPQDNPFVDQDNALPEIYSLGHRNPQGLAFDFTSQQLWAIEHGPRGGDELNLIEAGLNYGWPIVSHGKEYILPMAVGEATSKPGFVDPVQVYIPSIAPSSLLLKYTLPRQPQFFIGALKLQHINQLILRDKRVVVERHQHLASLQQRIRNVISGDNDNLIVATDSGNIYLVKIAR